MTLTVSDLGLICAVPTYNILFKVMLKTFMLVPVDLESSIPTVLSVMPMDIKEHGIVQAQTH